jgi:hypothetical protein
VKYIYVHVHTSHVSDLSNPIDSFYSIADAARSLDISKFKMTHVRDACKNNTQIDEFRFFIVEPDQKLPSTIPPTENVYNLHNPYKGLVAKLDKNRTKIIKVYATKNDAAHDNGVKACSITIATKCERMSAGHRWCMYEQCTDELRKNYTQELPQPVCMTSHKKVYRIDPTTDTILERFECVSDVVKKYKISHKTIGNLSKTKNIYKNYVWMYETDYEKCYT